MKKRQLRKIRLLGKFVKICLDTLTLSDPKHMETMLVSLYKSQDAGRLHSFWQQLCFYHCRSHSIKAKQWTKSYDNQQQAVQSFLTLHGAAATKVLRCASSFRKGWWSCSLLGPEVSWLYLTTSSQLAMCWRSSVCPGSIKMWMDGSLHCRANASSTCVVSGTKGYGWTMLMARCLLVWICRYLCCHDLLLVRSVRALKVNWAPKHHILCNLTWNRWTTWANWVHSLYSKQIGSTQVASLCDSALLSMHESTICAWALKGCIANEDSTHASEECASENLVGIAFS